MILGGECASFASDRSRGESSLAMVGKEVSRFTEEGRRILGLEIGLWLMEINSG